MFDLEKAASNVSAICRGVGKVMGIAPWRPRIMEDLSPDLRLALARMPLQGTSDELHYVLGHDGSGSYRYERMDKMPHLMVAGTTGSGKSVFINGLLVSLLSRHTPATLKLGLIDPKQVEFACYGSLPHLIGGVATDCSSALPIVQWAVEEMERRLVLLVRQRVKDMASYNASVVETRRLPRVVLVVDEFADIILGAVTKEEKEEVKAFEVSLTRLAQKARAVGIHLILSTQKPTVKVVTSILKGNIPARVALKVANASDSRVIVDTKGAEELNGKGDMLFQAPTGGSLERLQGVWVPDSDIFNVVEGS